MAGAKRGGFIHQTIAVELRRFASKSCLGRCPSCQQLFWTEDAELVGEIQLDFDFRDPSENPTRPEWNSAPELQHLSTPDREALLLKETSGDRRRSLLLELWPGYLDRQFKSPTSARAQRIGHLNRDMLNAFSGNGDYSLLLEAEVNRLSGNFELAIELARSLPKHLSWVGYQIELLCAQKKTGPAKLEPLEKFEQERLRKELNEIPIDDKSMASSGFLWMFRVQIPWENLRGAVLETPTGTRLRLLNVQMRGWPEGPLITVLSAHDEQGRRGGGVSGTYNLSAFKDGIFRCMYPPTTAVDFIKPILYAYASRFDSRDALFEECLDPYEQQSLQTLAQGARRPATGLEKHFMKVLAGDAIPASPLENLWYKEVTGAYFNDYITHEEIDERKHHSLNRASQPESDWDKASRFDRNQRAVWAAAEYLNHKGNVPNVLNVPATWLVTYSDTERDS